jgi:hypothetical protein
MGQNLYHRYVTGDNRLTRVKAKIEFPELNVDGDVYRIVGGCNKLNPVVTHSLKPHGSNP